MSACLKASAAVTALTAQATALTAISKAPVAVQQIAKNYSSVATYMNLLKKLNTNITYIKNMYTILTNTTYFTAGTTGWADGVTSLNNYGTTSHGNIMAVAAGYWSSSSQWTNIFVNGTQVNTTSLNPSAVRAAPDENTVNCIAVPTVTATEYSDGAVGWRCFTAK